MSAREISENLEQLGKALARLEDMLRYPDSHAGRTDAVIQRFEFSIELFWKTLKHLLAASGIEAKTPKACLQEAFAAGWLGDDDAVWIAMLKDRNLTSHTYKEDLAEEISGRIKAVYQPLLRSAYQKLMTVKV
jgi:nucleotidyltransferase substrate binding protein (TIGR01987 family)